MSVTLVPEDDLRAALRPYRVDPGTFESAVRARVSDSLSHADDLLASLSPAQRSAAAFLPLEVIAAGQDRLAESGIHLAPASQQPGEVAFLFPGQGSQYPGMMRDQYVKAYRDAYVHGYEHGSRL